MEQTVSVVEAQANFTQILNEIGEADQETIIQRDNQPIAVLISYGQYQELLALREQTRTRAARFAVYDEIRMRNVAATPEEVEADVAAAVQAVRANQV